MLMGPRALNGPGGKEAGGKGSGLLQYHIIIAPHICVAPNIHATTDIPTKASEDL